MDDIRREKAELEAEEQVELTNLERIEVLGRQQGEIFREYQKDKRRWAVVAFVAFIAIAGVAWAVASSYGDDAERDEAAEKLTQVVADMTEQRATSRVASCAQAVEFQSAHNDLVRKAQESSGRTRDLLRAILASTENPDTRAFIEDQIALYEADVAGYELNIVRLRDCSAQGLEDFANGTGGFLP